MQKLLRHLVIGGLCAAVTTTSFVGSASALSCRMPNFARTFNDFQKSDTRYMIAYGDLRSVPAPDYVQLETDERAYELSASFMMKSRWQQKNIQVIKVKKNCVSTWCGNFPEDTKNILMFLDSSSDEVLVLHSHPCPSGTLENPTPNQLDEIKTCLKNGRCEQRQLDALEPRFE